MIALNLTIGWEFDLVVGLPLVFLFLLLAVYVANRGQ